MKAETSLAPVKDDPYKQDSYAAYTWALAIAIVLTLGISLALHFTGCVPPSYFPFSREGGTAVILVVAAFLLCYLFRGFNITYWLGGKKSGRKKFEKKRVKIDTKHQWLVEIAILLPSIASLYLLLRTSGGVGGPFSAYLGTFPIVVSVLSSSRPFAVITFLLTLVVYILTLFFAPQVHPNLGHEHHYDLALIVTFSASLAFTTMLVLSEKEEGVAKETP
jgi:hypothetical protein